MNNLSGEQAAMRERHRKSKPNQRLSDAQQAAIVAWRGDGMSELDLAAAYGVSKHTVRRLVRKAREAR